MWNSQDGKTSTFLLLFHYFITSAALFVPVKKRGNEEKWEKVIVLSINSLINDEDIQGLVWFYIKEVIKKNWQ